MTMTETSERIRETFEKRYRVVRVMTGQYRIQKRVFNRTYSWEFLTATFDTMRQACEAYRGYVNAAIEKTNLNTVEKVIDCKYLEVPRG